VNNTQQVVVYYSSNNWDDGYPSGGNYWSDYNGTDLYSGPYQNETGSDGIGDTPYVIDANNQDNYPLLQPANLVENIDTDLTYPTIQEAINAPETLDGHTIEVGPGTYYEQVVVSKSLTIKGLHPSTTIIDGQDTSYDTGFLVYANDTTITGFTLQKYTKGIEIWGYNCNVSGNTFGYNYDYCIYLEEDSSNNIISNNDLSTWGGKYSIYLKYSDNNTIIGNTVTGKFIGIYIVCSNYNTIRNNTFSYCTIKPISSGMYLRESNNNVISGNTISNNNYGIYIDGANNIVSDNIISDNENTGIWVGGDDNTINDNTISNNWSSDIYISFGSFNTVSGNVISNSGCGIVLDDDNNTIVENTIQNNEQGIYSYSASNTFCHNNFVNNTQQVVVYYSSNNWDDGYPSGGNYWSDHDCTGNPSDGSQPYIIDANNIDHYPFQDPNGWL
jgi:parallel beta-helix repeat protein